MRHYSSRIHRWITLHTLKHTKGSHNHTLKIPSEIDRSFTRGFCSKQSSHSRQRIHPLSKSPFFHSNGGCTYTHTHTLTEAASRTLWPGCCYANSCAKVKSSQLKQIMFKWIDLFSNTLFFLFRNKKFSKTSVGQTISGLLATELYYILV